MHVNRGLVFWGVALITAGAVALAIQFGAIAGETARDAWRFWPVALIVIGLAVIAARTPLALVATLIAAVFVGGMAGTLVAGWPDGVGLGCAGEPTETGSGSGELSDGAAVDLRFNCGDLGVTTESGSGWSVEARHGSDDEVRIDDDSGGLAVEGDGGGFIGFADTRHEWDVVLPTDVAIDLEVSANAASSNLDLSGASISRLALSANAGDVLLGLGGADVSDLSIDGNAGAIAIDVDASTRLDGSIQVNAGSLELCAPDSAVVEITMDDPNVTFNHDLDDHGFTRDDDTWRSGSGDPEVTLEIDGNAASFSYNPDGGCS